MSEQPPKPYGYPRSIWLLPLVLLLSCAKPEKQAVDYCKQLDCHLGAITRGVTSSKQIALVFTGDEFADGMATIQSTLQRFDIKGGFFFTGNFYRNSAFDEGIRRLVASGHYLGAHSDRHLLYCDWGHRDSLLVTKEEFVADLGANYREMERFGVTQEDATFFLPPYEWYNEAISKWTKEFGVQLINYSPGTISHADYTTPDMPNYRSSDEILESILSYEQNAREGLKGFILLSHIGVAPQRTDKFYLKLEALIGELKARGYSFKRIDELLNS